CAKGRSGGVWPSSFDYW
nr:immunoglobulin heavy chain junction region [Macaca mulatta]MOX59908.1 immunoglobulin heavy chain junction region [Macaca mulatta]MOX61533.1 immunoglobulin heavy chain junction region [Macaca mulatta]MOX61894.1 immunoglobulin heavy chain junction region [Macaca mulatta]MOX62198.1 immunoglobulin heavy chain junction region [Macaca mulatta]